MNNKIDFLRNYAEGKIDNNDFEKFIYSDKELLKILGSNLYNLIIENNYKDERSTISIRADLKIYLYNHYPQIPYYFEDLTTVFPQIIISNHNLNYPYRIASQFSDYLIEMFEKSNWDELIKGFDYVEKLLNSPDDKVREVTTLGILEGVQNSSLHKKIDLELFLPYMKNKAIIEWKSLNDYWGS